MNDYEILLMLDPEVPEDRQQEILRRAQETVEKAGGSWLSADPWGRRRLAYEIDKKTDGVYHLLTFDAEPEALDEVTRVLKITDGVMRHMATRRVAQPQRAQAASAAPPAAVGTSAPEEYPASSESETEGGA